MDSRGWSVKNVAIDAPLGAAPAVAQSDRLIMPTQQAEPSEVHAYDDMLDMYNNPAARDVQQRVQETTQHVREEAMQHMRQAQSRAPQQQQSSGSDDVSFSPYP